MATDPAGVEVEVMQFVGRAAVSPSISDSGVLVKSSAFSSSSVSSGVEGSSSTFCKWVERSLRATVGAAMFQMICVVTVDGLSMYKAVANNRYG
jgi:hypothetical protein